jgi:hypothetical protein
MCPPRTTMLIVDPTSVGILFAFRNPVAKEIVELTRPPELASFSQAIEALTRLGYANPDREFLGATQNVVVAGEFRQGPLPTVEVYVDIVTRTRLASIGPNWQIDPQVAARIEQLRAIPGRLWQDREIRWADFYRLWPPQRHDIKPLRPAPVEVINNAIGAVYDDADKDQEKPPNLNEVVQPVKVKLADLGFKASKRSIQDLASKEPHSNRRLSVGSKFLK